jgi:hypothetical protein
MVTLTGLSADRNVAHRRSISVSGTAIARISADLIVWHVEISDFDKDMLAAKQRNDLKVKAILGLRRELGIQNDYRPVLWAVPVFLAIAGVVLLGLRFPAVWVLVVLLIPLFLVARTWIINQRLQDSIVSCGNHSGFWGSHEFDGSTALPGSVEFADFLKALHQKEAADPLRGRRCPGFTRVGSKTGVVFVGGGLHLASLPDVEVLIAFCLWNCHPLPYDHQHYLVWESGQVNGTHRGYFRRGCADAKEMILRLEKALGQADEGVVPYSRGAHSLLAHELEKRKQLIGL